MTDYGDAPYTNNLRTKGGLVSAYELTHLSSMVHFVRMLLFELHSQFVKHQCCGMAADPDLQSQRISIWWVRNETQKKIIFLPNWTFKVKSGVICRQIEVGWTGNTDDMESVWAYTASTTLTSSEPLEFPGTTVGPPKYENVQGSSLNSVRWNVSVSWMMVFNFN